MTENDRNHLEKDYLTYNLNFELVQVPFVTMWEAGFMTKTAGSHQGAIKMLWLHHICTVNVWNCVEDHEDVKGYSYSTNRMFLFVKLFTQKYFTMEVYSTIPMLRWKTTNSSVCFSPPSPLNTSWELLSCSFWHRGGSGVHGVTASLRTLHTARHHAAAGEESLLQSQERKTYNRMRVLKKRASNQYIVLFKLMHGVNVSECTANQPPPLHVSLALQVWFIPLTVSLCVFQEFVQFFKDTLDRKVCWADRLEFINGWYILLIISDIFTITGSVIKVGIETKVCPANKYTRGIRSKFRGAGREHVLQQRSETP